MSYQLGIDLGTTYTAAAVCRSDDRRWVEPEVVTLGTRTATVPSVLFVAPDGSVLVGDAAERRAVTDPDRVVREFKRRIGDPTPVVAAGRAWAPEELAARLVRWVVDRVAEREGGSAAGISVTHPASWGQHKKELLATALGGQGLTVTFLAEPQAAALHYAANERIAAGSTIAVYDLGGGTFDAAVVRKADAAAAASAGAAAGAAGFGLLGRPEGLERLGGVDFDEVVFEHVREGMPAAFEDLDDTDPAVLSAVARLRRDCTEAKEALSADTDVSIPVMMPAARGSVRLHRSEFESMIRPQVEETVAALRTAVRSAGLEPEQLTTVLLVGGSSRIPLVAQLVSEQLGRPVAVDADPKNAIAKGAALAISPKPTASWPEVAIVPVPAAAGAVAAGMGVAGLAASAAPPVRPPRPPLPGSPQQGAPQQGAAQRGAAAYAASPRGPVGPSHEPATELMSGGDQPPQSYRPRVDPAPVPDWEYQSVPEPRRRNVGLLVGIGGLLAVLAVVIVVVVLSNSTSSRLGTDIGTAGSGSSDVTSTEAPAAPTSAPAAGGTTGGGAAAATKPENSGSTGGGTRTTTKPNTGTGGGTATTPSKAPTPSAPAVPPPSSAPVVTPTTAGTTPVGNTGGSTTPGGSSAPPTGSAEGTGTNKPGGSTTVPVAGGTGTGTGGTSAGGSTAVAEPPATTRPAPAAAI
ncbi:Hsp70 family protein [Pseudonocardia sp.]|uniref:Hsp70 family protein n=1 Tax=Pseudonocardia sp. TaxID=60912 RepID=UPI002626CEB9|nr:Hsp70 family protein [Pseudonocardia sp.]MCW2716966.1 Heat shock protein 70 [Pseudonocardia sp.]